MATEQVGHAHADIVRSRILQEDLADEPGPTHPGRGVKNADYRALDLARKQVDLAVQRYLRVIG